MPWDVKKSGSKWVIYKPGSGKVVGHSTSKAKAEASVRARYWAMVKKEKSFQTIRFRICPILCIRSL